MKQIKISFIITLFFCILCPKWVYPSCSSNFCIPFESLNIGGASLSSNYMIFGSIGESIEPAQNAVSSNYKLCSGFVSGTQAFFPPEETPLNNNTTTVTTPGGGSSPGGGGSGSGNTTSSTTSMSTTTTMQQGGGNTSTTTSSLIKPPPEQTTSTTTSIKKPCVFEQILKDDYVTLNTIRLFRDKKLLRTPLGLALISLYYTHTDELTSIVGFRSDLAEKLKIVTLQLTPLLKANLKDSESLILNSSQYADIIEIMNLLKDAGSPALRQSVLYIMNLIEKQEHLNQLGIEIR